jgi:tRNA-dihydrouridine synthase B
MVIDWVRPDFIDLNFGCPVNKVVTKNGGSSLLRDCPLLEKVARGVVEAVAPFPVTAKIRIGWDRASVNAVDNARMLEDCGIRAVAVHGRTKEQGYSGEADWDVIAQVAESVKIPVIGNGDITSATDVKHRRDTTRVAGVMIGRGAMSAPWIFREIKHFLATGEILPPPSLEAQWDFIRRHCRLAVGNAPRAATKSKPCTPCAPASWPTRAGCPPRATCATTSPKSPRSATWTASRRKICGTTDTKRTA